MRTIAGSFLVLSLVAGCAASAGTGVERPNPAQYLLATRSKVARWDPMAPRKVTRKSRPVSALGAARSGEVLAAYQAGALRVGTGSTRSMKARPGTPRYLGWSNGKPGDPRLLNRAMLLKSGAMHREGAFNVPEEKLQVGRRTPEPYRAMVKNRQHVHMLAKIRDAVGRPDAAGIANLGSRMGKGSARQPSGRRLGHSNGKKGKLSQFNTTMLVKSGALHRSDAIQVSRPRIRVGRRAFPTFHRGVPRMVHRPRPPRSLNQRMVFRRSHVGGRCFGTSCDD